MRTRLARCIRDSCLPILPMTCFRNRNQELKSCRKRPELSSFTDICARAMASTAMAVSKSLSRLRARTAKYRLGNEAETYGEFIFVNNWLNPERSSDKAWMRTEVMIEANTSDAASYANFPGDVGNDQFRLREAFVQAGNLFDWQPDAKFWAGERYYRRQHIRD